MGNSREKGQPGYVRGVKKKNIRNSIIGVAAFVGIYLLGYGFSGSNANYLTVVAMLAILPTAQFMTKAFVYGRYYSVGDGFPTEAKRLTDRAGVLSEVVFVRKKNTFFFENMLITQGHVLAVNDRRAPKLGKSKAVRDAAAEKALSALFKQHGVSVYVKGFEDEKDLFDYFQSNVKPMLQSKNEEKQAEIIDLILRNAM